MYNDEFNNLNNQYHYTKKDHLPQDDYQTHRQSSYQYTQENEYRNSNDASNSGYTYTTNPQQNYHYGNGGPYTNEYYGTPNDRLKKTKRNLTWLKVIAAVLAVALISGICGYAGAAIYRTENKETLTLQKSSRKPTVIEVKNVDGLTEMSPAEVYAATVNSVVSINCSSTKTNIWGQVTQSASSGSGFVITKDGYIVTNEHVVSRASSVKVTLYNGESYDATVIGGDSDYDVAVIKIEANDLTPVVFGDSNEINVGDAVLAIGNPLGELTFSMSQGIISCCNRALNVEGTPFNMIQVDCSINPGNSGGPLMNAYGEVIGIVSAKYSTYSSTSVEGLGFSIPINDVNAIISDIVENGSVTNKAYLAITAGSMNESMASQYNIDVSTGVFVFSTDKGGAGEKAGLKLGDVITKIDSQEITSMSDLSAAKKNYRAGDTATLTVYREGEYIELQITFDSQPQMTGSDQSNNPSNDNNGGNIPNDDMQDIIDWYNRYHNFFGR